MERFITYQDIMTYTTLTLLVFMVVEFIKDLEIFKNEKTKYLSAKVAVALILLGSTGMYILTVPLLETTILGFLGYSLKMILYQLFNLPLYILTAVQISLAGNGLSDFNNKVDKASRE